MTTMAAFDRATRLRIVGLVALLYGVASDSSPGLHGAGHLAALLLTVLTGVTWAGWTVARFAENRPWSVGCATILAAAGAGLVVLTPVGIGVLIVGMLGVASLLEPTTALAVAAGAIVVTAIGMEIGGESAAVVGQSASAALGGLVLGTTRRHRIAREQQRAQLAAAEQRANVLEERNRIAREVHDVLAHTLSALSVQMNALDSMVSDGVSKGELQEAINRSRGLVVNGLDETRRAVHALRDEPVAVAEQISANAADSGASFRIEGTPRQLPPDAGLALVRIAQESLTNARKYAPGAEVCVTLRFDDDVISLVVENESSETAVVRSGSGYGIRGMHERAELVGGTVTAGASSNGWRVHATVPA